MEQLIRFPRRLDRTKVGSTAPRIRVISALFVGVCAALSPAQTLVAPSAAPAPSVQAIPALTGTAPATPASPRKKSYTLSVSGNSWLDTGLTVVGGETIPITASGTIQLADGRSVTPDGLDRGWKDLLRQFPLNQANTGELLGRVTDLGASVPFAIGAHKDAVMPTSGRLYLRANLSDDLSGTGSFSVTLRPSALSESSHTTGPAAAPAAPIASLLSPALFADIPRRVGDQAGDPGDMVNFALIGSQADVEDAFKAAGWVAVDRSTGAAVLHGLLSTLNHQAYTEMPMSTLYLFGRPQDLSFARADPLMVAAERHHLRVWRTTQTVGGRPLWVGSATHDIGFERDQRNGGTTHKIDPDIDAERMFLLQSFTTTGSVLSAAYVTPSNPMLEAHTATGGSFHSDGRIVVMSLRPELK